MASLATYARGKDGRRKKEERKREEEILTDITDITGTETDNSIASAAAAAISAASPSSASSTSSSPSFPQSSSSWPHKVKRTSHLPSHSHVLSDAKLELASSPPHISTLVVLYAVIKDHVVLPLVLGFLWTSILMLAGPLLFQLTHHGQRCGLWLARVLHLNGGPPSFLKPKMTTV